MEMDGAADGSIPDNCRNNAILYRILRHGLHYLLC